MAGSKTTTTVHTLSSDDTVYGAASQSYAHHFDTILIPGEELPLYSEQEQDIWPSVEECATLLRAEAGDQDLLPITKNPNLADGKSMNTATTNNYQIQILRAYYKAINSGKIELVSKFWAHELVTIETPNEHGRTPLLGAVEAEHTHMVKYLLDVGAEINLYGITETTRRRSRRGIYEEQYTYRTPLQHAAALGNLAIVKLLTERGADDSLIAPDGQLALRLAATNGHREVVSYLPRRRGGGVRRWKEKHSTAMRRCERAAVKILDFGKSVVWDVPRFFLWSIPKHLLVLPLIDALKWLRAHWKEIPARLARGAKSVADGLAKLPRELWDALRKFPPKLWRVVKSIAKFTWRSIKRIPHGLEIAFLWLWAGIKRTGVAIGNVLTHILSLLHTVCSAVASFLQRITLRDVVNIFVRCLRAIFIDAPMKLFEWAITFGEVSRKVLVAIFGGLGCVVWYLFLGIIKLFTYIPEKLWEMLMACGSSLRSGGREILVWFDPKRV